VQIALTRWPLILSVVFLLASTSPTCTQTSYPISFRHPEQGWSWRYPSNWHLQTFDDQVGFASHAGAILSSSPHHFDYPHIEGGSTSLFDFTTVPHDAVTIEFSQTLRFELPCKRTTATPIDLGNLKLAHDDPKYAYGEPPRHWMSVCVEGRSGFGLHVWIGPLASYEDIAALRSVVSSIRLPAPVARS
jgi:hypothetical protein